MTKGEAVVCVRREDLSKNGELRATLSPRRCRKILEQRLVERILVQPAIHPTENVRKRAFDDDEYVESGCEIVEDFTSALAKCDNARLFVFGVKEVDIERLVGNSIDSNDGGPSFAMLFFSHTFKGQVKNRRLLKQMMEKRVTLFDYELVCEPPSGPSQSPMRVLTAFTTYAGYAGMVDSLFALGQRLQCDGSLTESSENVFAMVDQSRHIDGGHKEAMELLAGPLSEAIRTKGTPACLPPVITAFLGSGRTSVAAQKVYNQLPVKLIGLDELEETYRNGSRNVVYSLVLNGWQCYRPISDEAKAKYAALDDTEKRRMYYDNPSLFESIMDVVIPYVTVQMNCITWAPNFPRHTTCELVRKLFAEGTPALKVIGDITCDPNGSVEFSKETWKTDPVFVWNPATEKILMGFEGEGVAVMGVTNLPTEYPRGASELFGDLMEPYLPALFDCDLHRADVPDVEHLREELLNSVELWRGKLTPRYEYMSEYIEEEETSNS